MRWLTWRAMSGRSYPRDVKVLLQVRRRAWSCALPEQHVLERLPKVRALQTLLATSQDAIQLK